MDTGNGSWMRIFDEKKITERKLKVDSDSSGRNREHIREGIEDEKDHRNGAERRIKIVRKEPGDGEHAGRNRISARLQKGRWIQIVMKEPGEENKKSSRLQKGRWTKIVRKEPSEERIRIEEVKGR